MCCWHTPVLDGNIYRCNSGVNTPTTSRCDKTWTGTQEANVFIHHIKNAPTSTFITIFPRSCGPACIPNESRPFSARNKNVCALCERTQLHNTTLSCVPLRCSNSLRRVIARSSVSLMTFSLFPVYCNSNTVQATSVFV